MKYLVLPLLLLLPYLAQAQSPITDRSRSIAPAAEAPADLSQVLTQKEAELSRLLAQYPTLSSDGQVAARDRMQELLYLIFDLSLQQKQREARALREKLERAEYNPSHRARGDVLDSLRQTLQTVESQLQFREENRDRIVMQRLHELL